MKRIEEIIQMNELVKDINEILKKNGVSAVISLADITITEKTVSDLVESDAKLSDAITNFLWPSITSATGYHYTSKAAAESILNAEIFRLNNIANRYSEGEIKTFCETHDLKGYLEKDGDGNPKYKHLIMPNTFYASFTDVSLTKNQEEYFWKTFAPCDGVRLKIEITASNPNFRKLKYELTKGTPIPLLAELTNCVRAKYNREFILKGISRLCSFYLSGEDYGIENEYRALYTVWEGFGPQPKKSEKHSYIELPLNAMSECGYQLNIVEVHAHEKLKIPDAYFFSKRGA